MDAVDIEIAAETLARARATARRIDDLPAKARPSTPEEGYAIQHRLHDMLSDLGFGAVAGHKIGCTTTVMQEYLKIDHPCAGKIMRSMVFDNDATYSSARLCRPGVECEIAVRLAHDLPGAAEPYSRETVAAAVGAAMASIELVDERWTDFTRLPAPHLIADDFFNAGCVLGPEVAIDPMTLDRLTGRMHVNGESIGEGVGSDILGHPLDALAWLANLRAGQGDPLKRDSFVTLGSIVKTRWIEKGDRVEMAIDGLGAAALSLS